MDRHLFDDGTLAARAAARHVSGRIRAAAEAGRAFTLAVSGGSTPGPMFAALAAASLPWSAVHVFQVDERIAPAGDADRNFEALRRQLLEPAGVPAANVHPMPVEAADPHGAALEHVAEILSVTGPEGVLDLVHLGMGADGHTASLVPGDPCLDEAGALVAVSGEYQGRRRMTFTFPLIERARERLWLLAGNDKAPALAKLLAGDPSVPAGRVPRAGSVLFADRAALGGVAAD